MNQTNSSKQVLLSVVGVAILVVAVVGVSFAFFNYTRTGAANTVTTGHIYFTTSQNTINVDDLFPVAASVGKTVDVENPESQVGAAATVSITGNTTYSAGLHYQVTAQNVNLKVPGTNKDLPISVYVTEALGSNSSIDSHAVYSYNADDAVSSEGKLIHNNALLAEGHIQPVDDGTANSVQNVITVRVYLDRNKIAITDTYNGTATTSDDMGTTQAWVNGRTVFTTAEWNSLHGHETATVGALSGYDDNAKVQFKIKVEGIEGEVATNNPGLNWIGSISTAGGVRVGS